MIRTAILIIFTLAAIACGTQQGILKPPAPLKVSGVYNHTPSGMVFPLSVSGFERGSIGVDEADNGPVSLEYSLSTAGTKVVATVDIYPSRPGLNRGASRPETSEAPWCLNDFDARKEEIIVGYPGSQLLSQNEVALKKGETAVRGNTATFEYEGVFDGKRIPLRSRLDVFCDSTQEWTVRYRFIYPSAFDADPPLKSFIEQLGWPSPAKDAQSESSLLFN